VLFVAELLLRWDAALAHLLHLYPTKIPCISGSSHNAYCSVSLEWLNGCATSPRPRRRPAHSSRALESFAHLYRLVSHPLLQMSVQEVIIVGKRGPLLTISVH